VGGTSVGAAAAVEEVNRFCATLPGEFDIRVVNVRTRTDHALLDRWRLASEVIDRERPRPVRLTKRQRAVWDERRIERTELETEGAAL
jgi:hypothetical protein